MSRKLSALEKLKALNAHLDDLAHHYDNGNDIDRACLMLHLNTLTRIASTGARFLSDVAALSQKAKRRAKNTNASSRNTTKRKTTAKRDERARTSKPSNARDL